MDYELPDNFAPTLAKDYRVSGNNFIVKVQSRGLRFPGVTAPILVWDTAVYVEENMVRAAPFYWDPSEHKMTDENVADSVAMCVAESQAVIQAQPQDNHLLDYLVEQCRAHMFKEFWLDDGKPGTADFDIHIAVLGEEGDFTIVLSMAVRPNMMYEFSRQKNSEKIEVSTWVKAHVYRIPQSQL
jgi:hypothetical protein